MKQTVRGRKRPGRRSDDKTKYARLLAIPAAIVLVLLIVILVMDKKPGSSKNTEDTTVSEASDISIEGDTESSTDDASIEPDNNEYNQDFSAYELQKDANPQVNELISTYFQAKVDQDAQMLYKVFGKEEDDRIEERKQQLKDEAVYIEDYQDIESVNFAEDRKKEGWEEEKIRTYLARNSRDHARTPMQWNAEKHAGFTAGTPWMAENQNYEEINVENSRKNPDSLFYFYQKLIALRRKNDTLVYGDFRLIEEENPDIFAYERNLGEKKLIVLCNFRDTAAEMKARYDLTKGTVLIHNDTESLTKEVWKLQPYEAYMIELLQ